MNLLRTLLSALSIVAGAFLIAAWAVSSVIVTAVEDGTAVRGVAERALESPAVVAAIADQAADGALRALDEAGVPVSGAVAQQVVRAGIEQAVSTDVFKDATLDQVDSAHEQFADQLTDSLREPAPLTLTVDLSRTINQRLDELGAVAAALPDVTVPGVTIEVLDADTFEYTRDSYARIQWADQWGLWVGIGLLVLGVAVSQRRRWFVSKVLLAVGVILLMFGGIIALLGPDTITTFLPGGDQGPLSTLWREILTEETAPIVMERSLWFGAIALGASVVLTLVGAVVGSRRR